MAHPSPQPISAATRPKALQRRLLFRQAIVRLPPVSPPSTAGAETALHWRPAGRRAWPERFPPGDGTLSRSDPSRRRGLPLSNCAQSETDLYGFARPIPRHQNRIKSRSIACACSPISTTNVDIRRWESCALAAMRQAPTIMVLSRVPSVCRSCAACSDWRVAARFWLLASLMCDIA